MSRKALLIGLPILALVIIGVVLVTVPTLQTAKTSAGLEAVAPEPIIVEIEPVDLPPTVPEDPGEAVAMGSDPEPEFSAVEPEFSAIEPKPEAIVVEPSIEEPYETVDVFYATNRVIDETTDDPGKLYTGEVDDRQPHGIKWGMATVSIPPNHERGVMESPNFVMKILGFENPDKHVILQSALPMTRDEVLAVIDGQLGSGEDSILAYVHGYNTSFEKAARRAGQLTYDLAFTGPSFFFSWPSKAKTAAYTHDSDAAKFSTADMALVLEDLVNRPAERVIVIAHSMGTRVLATGLVALHQKLEDEGRGELFDKISTIVLAAPDISKRNFNRNILPEFNKFKERSKITIYASAEDTALLASDSMNGSTRVGDTRDGLTLVDKIDFIDATDARSNFFEHTYFGDNLGIVIDLCEMIQKNLTPEQRSFLQAASFEDKPYWSFDPRVPKPEPDGVCHQ